MALSVVHIGVFAAVLASIKPASTPVVVPVEVLFSLQLGGRH